MHHKLIKYLDKDQIQLLWISLKLEKTREVCHNPTSQYL